MKRLLVLCRIPAGKQRCEGQYIFHYAGYTIDIDPDHGIVSIAGVYATAAEIEALNRDHDPTYKQQQVTHQADKAASADAAATPAPKTAARQRSLPQHRPRPARRRLIPPPSTTERGDHVVIEDPGVGHALPFLAVI